MRSATTQSQLVVGFGVTGRSAVRHLLRSGVQPIVLDTRDLAQVQNHDLMHEYEAAGARFHWNVKACPQELLDSDISRAIVSPGLSLESCLIGSLRRAGVEMVSDIDVFFEECNAPVTGITGTNGKSTVTSLVGRLLSDAGKKCGVGGNLGDAALDLLDETNTAYVLELSSFQLERSRLAQYAASTILNVSEDHLDLHGSMATYVASKHRLYDNAGRIVFNRMDSQTIPAKTLADRAVSFGLDEPSKDGDWGVSESSGARAFVCGSRTFMEVDAAELTGAHNELNMLAACALVDGVVDHENARRTLADFSGLAHRFELVAEHSGVRYINDSKATNLGATIAALEGLPRDASTILIAGGDAKGVDLSPLGNVLFGRVGHLFAIGDDGPMILKIAERVGVSATYCHSLEEAVVHSAKIARPSDVVLLSPACASFDMFKSYVERGEKFVAAVNGLTGAVDDQ